MGTVNGHSAGLTDVVVHCWAAALRDHGALAVSVSQRGLPRREVLHRLVEEMSPVLALTTALVTPGASRSMVVASTRHRSMDLKRGVCPIKELNR
jgi:hypothetical protein